MSLNTRESLSALMDGESDELELRRVLKALPGESDAADTWRRYHLARSMMQRERSVDVSVDLSAGILARLQDEPAPLAEMPATASTQRPARVSFARGAGVAAAVSLMVITGVQFLNSDGSPRQASQGSSDLASTSIDSGAQVQPVGLAASQADMPMFEPTAFRMNGQSGRSGFMNVSESAPGAPAATTAAQTFSAPTSAMDSDQIRLLQTYLEQHAQGAAGGSGDSWMPLLRSSSAVEPLGQR
ncbi:MULTISPECIES: sigma-E factor negative regulatory protein [unclassified Halomonas]|uniref:sigma-E factor negative regulatory protein n=1 Tax=unclassified Halomonas TaxID=2609666 RepID=UPI00209F11B3|nr:MULTISPECIES: sigma-E factor negative regulatory protein [unclassified Halomonas]MCP1313839.1 sigma-E factor negative regulatory protein [Halomonas sp. 707D7]MCP1326260.1 sigma-E factor negative regulatory protein [Halomonas sp. 707D4]